MKAAVSVWRGGISASEKRLRVVIGDGDDGFRRNLRETFSRESDIDVVGEADDGELALQLVRRLRPNVAVLDEDLPSLGGGAVARVLAAELPEVRVVILTAAYGGSNVDD
jgi:DNA-binding NarL/FixJ family response regulator